ncbi:hypothetical protein KC345_g3386 [Hortaea werneckii]|nr:hypothetical protein KC345_g3386 [Hortaea werneckii]
MKKSMLKHNQTAAAPSTEVKLPIAADLPSNVKWLYNELGASSSIVIRTIFDKASGTEGVLVYFNDLVDQQTVNQMILQPILLELGANQKDRSPSDWMGQLKNQVLPVGQITEVNTLDDVLAQLLEGSTIIMLQGCQEAVSAISAGGAKRSVEEPSSQTVVRGPKEGFTEDINTNLSLVHRRIKSPQLRVEFRQIGKQTKTKIAVLFLQGVAKDSIVEEVLARLDRIDTDSILDSHFIEEYIEDATFSPFPTILSTERPDAASASILEGQVVIMVDGSPFVLIGPATFIHFIQTSEDYYQRRDIATLLRVLRFGSFFLSMLLPALFIAITTINQEVLPPALLIRLSAQREGVPFPASVEVLLMELTFEVLREAGVRMPRVIGSTVSIVGGLVLGQAAVEAGFVSAALVIVVSFTAISNFIIPSFSMANAVRIVRFVMILLGATLGLFGIMCGILVLLLHMASIRSIGVSYLAPFSPFLKTDWQDVIVRSPRWAMKKRPISVSSKHNQTRQSSGQRPKPPIVPGHGQDPTSDSNE